MRILLTGGTGYIGKRLLPVLLSEGHTVICIARNAERLELEPDWKVEVYEHDFLEPVDIKEAPLDFDVAFYLMHSMSSSISDFGPLEERVAVHFKEYVERSTCKHIIYLTGMVNVSNLSRHLRSRFKVETILSGSSVPLTSLRAGIIVGSGSASFEIIRDLVEKLPVMVAPRWLNTRCEPIAIRDVIQFLTGVMLHPQCMDKNFDIGNGEVLTYKDMLLGYARVRKLGRWILTVPVMTPRLSSYWLYFVTSTTYELAVNLVNSMKVDVVARDHKLARLLNIQPISYETAVELAFDKIEQNMVISSWKDSLIHSSNLGSLSQFATVPSYGCFEDRKEIAIKNNTVEQVWANICAIGGDRGWYYGNFLWKVRGVLDKMVGGVGLRRGRTNPDIIYPGDSLDFWRVLAVDSSKKRLLLYAEMKLPGEAWLEFRIKNSEEGPHLFQTATFRPYGIMGRMYWYSVLSFHYFIFNGMIRNIERFKVKPNKFLKEKNKAPTDIMS